MKKIAILSFYNNLLDRGVESWSKLVKEKLRESFDVEIFSGKSFGNKIDWENKNYLYWRFLLLKHSLQTLSKWNKYDIIIPANGTVQTLICRLITWFKRKPMIVFGHSGPGADDKWNLLCSPNVFVAFSSHQKEWAEKFKLPWTKIVLIPHAIDLKRFTPAKVKPNQKIVLCVAANEPSKRVDLVKEAVDLIPGAKFMAVGKGNEIETSFGKMPEVYKKADVFCFVPQPWEAFGLVFLEAMATNLPIVTINDPVRREIVGDAGIFVDHPEDQQELSSAIEKALNSDWRNIPRKQAEMFSWDTVKSKYENLFNNVK
ncbi:MAG TPA: glycosyltransferase family 4 protein [Patescibacteria group bacterium]|nr:glycosyltransferase family 4 protein [Patescibacteria group bacterium]